MALKVIETIARISAEDKTGATFSEVAQKLKNMEGLAKRAGETTGRIGGTFGGIATKADAAVRSISAFGVAVGTMAAVAAVKLADIAENVIAVGVEFDKLTRRQRAVLNISPAQQRPLIEQANILGGTTPYNNFQVIQAQNALAQRGIPLAAIRPITQAASDYAQAQGIDLSTATKLIESAYFAEGGFKTKGSPEEIKKDISHIADVLVKGSQVSGLGAEEMEAFLKGHAATQAGVSLPFLMSQGATLHQAGIPEPGAAALRFATYLSKPTPDALAALDALGIHFKDYAKAGKEMRAEDLDSEFERLMGRKLSPIGLSRVQALLSNPEIAGDQAKLTKGLGDILGKNLKPKDAREVAKVIEKFWTASIDSVDVEGLERALIKKGLSASQAVGIFGKRSGMLFSILADHAKEQAAFEKQIRETKPGLAAREAETQMGGLAGAQQRFEGGWHNVLTTLSSDNEKWLTPLYNAGAQLEARFVEASDNVRSLTEAATGAAAGLGAFALTLKALSFIGILPGGAAVAGATGAGALGLGAAAAYEFLSHVPRAEGGDSYGLDHPGWHPGMPKESTRYGRFQPFPLLGNQPLEAGKFTPPPSGLRAFRLDGAANIGVRVDVGFDPGLIAKQVSQTLDANGNLRADTGVSMPRSMLPY